MNFLVTFNDVKPILYTFFGTIGFLILFMGVAYLSKFLSDKMKGKKVDKDFIRSEVYRLIYENTSLSKDDLIKYLDIKNELVEEAILSLLENDKIELKDKKYYIKQVVENKEIKDNIIDKEDVK